jgi:hypothetical protein
MLSIGMAGNGLPSDPLATCYNTLSSDDPMTLTEANQIWHDCYASDDLTLWSQYTVEQREQAISVRSAPARSAPALYDAEAERIERRQWERDGWKTAHLDRQRW